MRRRHLCLAWLAGVAVCLAVVLPARITTDMAAFLPKGATPEQELLVNQLRQGPASRLLIAVVGDAQHPVSAGALERLRANIDDTGLFHLVASHPDPTLLAAREDLFRYRYLLSDRWSPHDFEAPALRAHFEQVVERLRRADPSVDEDLLARDPGGEFEYLLHRWLGAQATGDHAHGWRLNDGRAVLLLMADAAAYDLDRQEAAIGAVREQAGALDSPLAIEVAGAPAIAVGTRDRIRMEAVRVSLLAFLAAVLVLIAALRTPRAVLLALVPVLSGLLAGAAAVRLGFGELHGITLAFGATLLGVTLDYPLHHLWRSRTGDGPGAARAIRRPLLVAALSTAFGFAALAIAGFPGLQQLALMSLTGIVTAAVVASWVLPALAIRPVRPFAAYVEESRPFVAGWLPPAIAGLLMVVGAGVLASGQLRMATDLGALSPVPAELAQRDGALRRALGLPEPRHLVRIVADTREAVLHNTETVAGTLEALEDVGVIARHDPVTRLLPSVRTQQARAQALPDAATLAAAVEQAVRDLPLRAGAFEAFVADVDASRELEPLQPEMLPDGMVRQRISERLKRREGDWVSLVYLGDVADPVALESALPGYARLVDLQAETGALMTRYQWQAMLHFALGAVAIAAILWFGTGSLRRTLMILMIAGGGVGGALILLAATGTALSVFHVVALLLVVGLSIDYGVFARPGDRVAAGSVTLCAVSSALAFSILATAEIPLLRAIGVTVACGTIIAWALALLFAGTQRASATGSLR